MNYLATQRTDQSFLNLEELFIYFTSFLYVLLQALQVIFIS